ncbi:hypothetical protein BRARA_C04079 [Brassica rapa]|uniref:DUF4283 domain-containing protein n=1 Tax=Brassica campestris TaxID=3711 RepID=A0A398A682_BRACM|nr:hypothetical protein BRARA_C04079 [Brassica rapa]
MARRYSRHEKEKWVPSVQSVPKRPPVQIPPSNNENLIAANKLTIMGRVTNPTLQRPRAVVDFLPQIWNLEGRMTGRELGPEKFQMKFESEEDLLSVLNKGPYHYKKWMILLQRWEPVVSEAFPSSISFWLRIHDLPLHYWNDQTLDAIGVELGTVTGKIADDARVRVEMNGLRPLVMQLEIQLPSGDLQNVELEYIKIEKHCFTCFSLLHEEVDCPNRPINPIPLKERKLGITQRIALQRIEADKKRHDDRRGYSRYQSTESNRSLANDTRERRSFDQARGHPYRFQGRTNSFTSSKQDEYYNTHRLLPAGRSSDHIRRDEYESRRELSSGKIVGSKDDPRSQHSRRNFLGDNTSGKGDAHSSGRKSALDRLKDPEGRNISPRSSSSKSRIATPENLVPKQDKLKQNGDQRSTSGPRVPASLRLQEPALQIDNVTISLPPRAKQTGNRKVSRVSVRRPARTPLMALKPKRTTATKSANPSRKKIALDKPTSLPCNKAGTSRIPRSNSTRDRQRKRTEGQDFHLPRPPLP